MGNFNKENTYSKSMKFQGQKDPIIKLDILLIINRVLNLIGKDKLINMFLEPLTLLWSFLSLIHK